MEPTQFRVTVSRREGYAFSAGFDDDTWPLVAMDEPQPLGQGGAPNPTRVLGAAVGACLSSSLLFCLAKARVDVGGLDATVVGTVARNDEGRLRITELRVSLSPSVAAADRDRMQRCVSVFEDFCTVTASVRKGIPVHVEVTPTSSD